MSRRTLAYKRDRKPYPLHQSPLFKLNAKRRLAEILRVDIKDLTRLAKSKEKFRVFEIPAGACEFTGKPFKARWVQNPIAELKSIHRRLQALLSRVIVPDFCHGGTKGKSYRSNALVHTSASTIATFDLQSFFPSTSSAQVFKFFRQGLQCSSDVAGLLTDLCTCKGALATGSPVSPLLAYWANRDLFEALRHRTDKQNLQMSVYVDDLTISGSSLPRRLTEQVDGIVRKYGHKLSVNKTKRFGANTPKHITGVVIYNGVLHVPYSRFQKARAIEKAIATTQENTRQRELIAKLSGLLGEAAFIDPRYLPWARRTYKRLTKLKA